MNHTTLTPLLSTLITSLRLARPHDPALERALETTLSHLADGVSYAFDGATLRVVSVSTPGQIHIVRGDRCSCRARNHPWCWHRVFFLILRAKAALESPEETPHAACAVAAPRTSRKPVEEMTMDEVVADLFGF